MFQGVTVFRFGVFEGLRASGLHGLRLLEFGVSGLLASKWFGCFWVFSPVWVHRASRLHEQSSFLGGRCIIPGPRVVVSLLKDFLHVLEFPTSS